MSRIERWLLVVVLVVSACKPIGLVDPLQLATPNGVFPESTDVFVICSMWDETLQSVEVIRDGEVVWQAVAEDGDGQSISAAIDLGTLTSSGSYVRTGVGSTNAPTLVETDIVRIQTSSNYLSFELTGIKFSGIGSLDCFDD